MTPFSNIYTAISVAMMFIIVALLSALFLFSISTPTQAESFGAEYRLQERQTKALEQIAREIGRLEICK